MAPAEGAVAEPAQTTTTTAAPDSTSTSTTAGTQAASQPAPKWEDTPQYKGQVAELQKERKARQDFEKRITDYEAKLTEERRRVAALSGITPPDPKQADANLVKSKLLEFYPELAELSSIKELKSDIEKQHTLAYKGHSEGILSKIHQGISAEYGDLSDAQKKLINNLYFAANFNDPEIHQRHNSGDPTLIAEFVKEVIDGLVEPIKRKATASEASRFRPVPGGRDRSTPIKGEKPKSSEEMLRAHYKESTRPRG